MSSILDALKKSDQQRSQHADASPYLHTGSDRQSARRRRWRLPLVLLLLAGTAVAWWWLSHDSRARPEVSIVTGSQAETALESAAATVESEPATATPEPSPETVGSSNDQVIGVEPVPTVSIPQADLPAKEAPFDDEPMGLPLVEEDMPILTQPSVQDDIQPVDPEPSSPAPIVTEDAPEDLIQLSQLPAEDREALNALKISIVVYNPEPARAFAIINGSRHRIGDNVLDGVRLSRITREGLVLDVDGQRVLMSKR